MNTRTYALLVATVVKAAIIPMSPKLAKLAAQNIPRAPAPMRHTLRPARCGCCQARKSATRAMRD